MDEMGLNSMALRIRMFFLLFFISSPVILMATLMYQSSSFRLFVGFPFSKGKGKVLEPHNNFTTNAFGLGTEIQNTTTHKDFGGGDEISDVKVLSGETQNGTAAEGTPENLIVAEVVTAPTSPLIAHRLNCLKNGSSTNDSGIPDDRDKLLHGLLASGFDEASCISRLQSYLYRKAASPHKPSPYLISKLRNYEEIHTRCGPNSRAYNRNMIRIVHSKNNGNGVTAAMCKYLVWTPVNGLGNQMISIAATFLYAILTDRVLLVKFGKDKHGLFCEPFLNSTWQLPEKSPFWNENHVETYQRMLEKDRASANNSKEEKGLPSALFLNLQHTRSDPEKLFHCDHSQDLLRKVPLLILQSDQYFVPSLFMTPSFNLEITKMFPEKATVFHHLGRYLFHPSNEAWGLISRFYKAHLAKADERIGLQIRVFRPVSTPPQAVMNLVLSCTIMNKLLPEVVAMQNSVSSATKNQMVKAVLVASLYAEHGEILQTKYLKKQSATGEVIEVYQPSHERRQKYNDNKHNMKAWTEMYLLSLSDVLVTTSLSTFGYVAQGLGNLRPWLLYKLTNNETHFPACERDFSLEPCYHTPPKHYCNGKPIKDFASSFPYMRECKDFRFGVKLVNG
ncbi:Xyloglucan fucosyltransferase [Sesbania bispinosa]|nr:Xyloglucan fucosyltransferase [Sesbania bispinosa]